MEIKNINRFWYKIYTLDQIYDFWYKLNKGNYNIKYIPKDIKHIYYFHNFHNNEIKKNFSRFIYKIELNDCRII